MGVQSRWEKYPSTYREKEMRVVAGWISAGESGAVVGLPGTGRATLLNILCRRPEILKAYLDSQNRKAVFIPVDLNNLPDKDLATLYRVILRSFYENRERLDEPNQVLVTKLYQKYEAANDPFLPQSGLRELLLNFEKEEKKVVLVMNRFDRFCKSAKPRMTWTLRGLRDSFKETLCFIMGMSQEVTYLSELPSVEPLRSILDTHVLWVGPLSKVDEKDMIERELEKGLEDDVINRLLLLTGGFPSLIRVVCYWWSAISETQGELVEKMLAKASVQHRLYSIFDSLTQEEQSLLRDVATRRNSKGSLLLANPTKYERTVLEGLARKGICREKNGRWEIVSQLLEMYPKQAPGQSWGRIWWNETKAQIYQGIKPVELTPLEQSVLEYFIENPQRRLTYTELAEGAWPDDNAGAVTPEAIQQVIRGVRKRIEPKSSKPNYVISWRGQPEGGYQFFPEGRPN